jgi:hypothetical protein
MSPEVTRSGRAFMQGCELAADRDIALSWGESLLRAADPSGNVLL